MNLQKAAKIFPSRDQTALLLSIFLSILLFSIEFSFSYWTNSLLLFCIGILQTSLTVFVLVDFFLRAGLDANIASLKRTSDIKTKLVSTFLNGFAILLFTGYIFFEFLERLTEPTHILSNSALPVAIICLLVNRLIITLLFQTDLQKQRFGTFKLPIFSIVILPAAVIIGLSIIYWTDFYFLDALLSFLIGFFIFVRAGFMMLDAYWHLYDIA